MSLSTPFIHRPVATTLLTLAIAMSGALAYFYLPVSPLPQVEFPTISVSAGLPGASPETMASAVATPLERQFGRIAGVTEMTSSSTTGNSSVTLQFDLSRNIDAAARDVQAAINAARGQLPTNLPSNPTYRKVNPADAPILILAITSEAYDRGPMYDAASSILQQKLSQVDGVGQVSVGGSALPAVRVEANPVLLNSFGLGLEDVRTALGNSNANRPKGAISDDKHTSTLAASDQLYKAAEYKKLIISYRNQAPVLLGTVAEVNDSVEDIHTGGLDNGNPAVMLIIYRQPGANIIETCDRVINLIPQLQSEIPAAMHLRVAMDRTTTIRASVRDVETTLLISLSLVILVVFAFLRNVRATFIPSIVVPVSLIGTFGVMYICHYSIDNLSLMALTICTGFVVDDAIVVIENITRHLEEGMTPMQASLRGAREIGFTVLSISVSLVAVFIPILLMGGIVGRLFREFAVVLTVAIAVSLIVSLTTTPMMCARLLKHKAEEEHGRLYRFTERIFVGILKVYEWTLARVMRHPFITLMVTLSTVAFTIYLYFIVPKGFFPQQDTGRVTGNIIADQDTSFKQMSILLKKYSDALLKDKDVEGVDVFVGGSNGGALNSARMFITLKPIGVRKIDVDHVIAHFDKECSGIAGATANFQGVQDIRIGGRSSALQYQYTLQGDNLDDLKSWAPKVEAAIRKLPGIARLQSDQQDHGLSANLVVDRATAARLGVTQAAIDSTLYDAFGQRQVSTTYTSLNQYHVVLEANPTFTQGPEGLKHIYVEAPNAASGTSTPLAGGSVSAPGSTLGPGGGASSTANSAVAAVSASLNTTSSAISTGGKQIPLFQIAHYDSAATALAVNHTGQFPSITISFNLKPGIALGDAVEQIQTAGHEMGMPASIHGTFAGQAQAYQASLKNEPILIAAALLTVYIVLGILYESYIHPITIISTLPSAGVGAILALIIFNTPLDVMGMIGIVLLIGIVKKNAIMMVDFAIETERNEGKSPKEAIFQACLMRFRPIIMTTMAALLGAMPLAFGTGTGAEMRRPLGIAIVGGLIFSQILTLYTTPVVYLYLDRLRLWMSGGEQHPFPIMPHGQHPLIGPASH
jgi:multidrug efflux pump